MPRTRGNDGHGGQEPADERSRIPFGTLPEDLEGPGQPEVPGAPGGLETHAARGAPPTWKGFSLLDFQLRAIEAIGSGANVLVSAPTGAGKTLIAEYAIAQAVALGRRCVYTAPIKALSNQKYRDFRDDPKIDVGLMTGDVTIRPQARVLIMTTEILRNAIFEAPRELGEVEFVIFDEIHYMDDVERGSVWEESLIFAPSMRFIGLSATVANLDQLGAWIREIRPQELEVVRSDRRPVPLKHRLHTQKSGLFPLNRLAYAQRHEAGRGGRKKRPGRGRGRALESQEQRGLTRLFDHLQERDLLPALVFSFSRRDCERLASRAGRRALLDTEESRRMQALQSELIELFQLDELERQGEVFQLAARGVAYHHAGMLPVHKEVVERMFTSGLVKLLFTTETFALGINMPARTAVFAGLRKFDGVNFDYLRTREYLQMAGRAGRQGIDKEGLVVATLDAEDLAGAPLKRLLSGAPEPIHSRFRLGYSTILHLYESLGRERLYEAWDKSFHQYQSRARSRKARERQRQAQRDWIDRRLALLADLHYVDDEEHLTPRGRLAKLLVGFELQLTELVYGGILEELGPRELAVCLLGLPYEDRRRGGRPWIPEKLVGGMRKRVDRTVRDLIVSEVRFGIREPLKEPDWGLTESMLMWVDGADFEQVEENAEIPGGDLCRSFRLSLMLARQLRRALDKDDPLRARLRETIELVDRGEVDARRQLELG